MTIRTSFDKDKAKAFTQKALADTSGMATTVMAHIGDQLGLFKNLAEYGPATSAELASRANINERYAREWLSAMTCAGYLEYDPSSKRFTLPPEHKAVLAQETGRLFFGGIHQMLIGMMEPLEQVIHAFQHGGGVPQSAYADHVWHGLERDSLVYVENYLVQQWSAAIP